MVTEKSCKARKVVSKALRNAVRSSLGEEKKKGDCFWRVYKGGFAAH
jgi:hypothetical protein